jgi:hypothetical protein
MAGCVLGRGWLDVTIVSVARIFEHRSDACSAHAMLAQQQQQPWLERQGLRTAPRKTLHDQCVNQAAPVSPNQITLLCSPWRAMR